MLGFLAKIGSRGVLLLSGAGLGAVAVKSEGVSKTAHAVMLGAVAFTAYQVVKRVK